MRVQITQRDLNFGKVFTPGWHVVEVTKHSDETAKDGSAMAVYELTCTQGPCEGFTARANFSEKAASMSLPFAIAAGRIQEGILGEYELDDSFVGIQMKVKTGIRTWEGKDYTNVLEYRSINS